MLTLLSHVWKEPAAMASSMVMIAGKSLYSTTTNRAALWQITEH